MAKSLVHGALDCSGRPKRQRKRLGGKLVILTYHSFCSVWPRGLFCSLPVNRFEKQIRFLRENFRLVSLEQGIDCLRQGYAADQPMATITIDDGFRDNYTHAWPVLRRYAVPATVFLATDFIDTGRLPWPTQLAEILEETQEQRLGAPFSTNIKNLSARSAAARELMKLWSSVIPEERFAKLTKLRRHLHVGESTQYPPMTWDQIREMQTGGIRFGSHTIYHSILPATDPTLMMWELRESKQRIETELQESCTLFAYPDGKYNLLSISALAACGYDVAVTQDFGVNQDTEDCLQLKRIEIPYIDPMPSFRVRVSLAMPSRS